LETELRSQGGEVANLQREERRKRLQDIGNQLRASDSGILVKKALQQRDTTKDTVIDSLKNPFEIEELRRHPNAYVIALDVSFEQRCQRILNDQYKNKLDQFIKDDDREKDERIPHGQRLQECIDLADILINNEKNNSNQKDWDDYEKGIMDDFIRLLKSPAYREPTDMELWMQAAYSISLQSKCIKRQVGAIIVKGEHVVAAGKNDVPQGEQACREIYKKCYRDILRKEIIKRCPQCGTPLDKDFHCTKSDCEYNESSLTKLLDKCRSLHAEESAILQASKMGGVGLSD